MDVAGLLTVTAALCFAAGMREFGQARRQAVGRRASARRRRQAVPRWMGLAPALGREASLDRLVRADALAALGLRGLVLSRIAAASFGALAGILVGGPLPGRLAALVPCVGLALGLIGPDLALERRARRRREQVVARLAEAIDILAIGVAGGQGTRGLLAGLAEADQGPLARELAQTVAELEGGASLSAALAALRRRVPGPEIAQLTLAIERSTRLGSPLAAELDRQSSALREARRRAIAERAARASPKIQLVIALVLVPSVLLLIAAALAANADRFFGAL